MNLTKSGINLDVESSIFIFASTNPLNSDQMYTHATLFQPRDLEPQNPHIRLRPFMPLIHTRRRHLRKMRINLPPTPFPPPYHLPKSPETLLALPVIRPHPFYRRPLRAYFTSKPSTQDHRPRSRETHNTLRDAYLPLPVPDRQEAVHTDECKRTSR